MNADVDAIVTPSLPPENIFGHSKKLAFLLAHLAHARTAARGRLRVLDFGCGNGEAVSQYLIGEGVEYVGVEMHAPSLAYARARFGGPHARFVDRVPEGERFDVLVYADVLEHLPDPGGLLQAHAASLVADGCLLGSVPNGYGPYELEARLDAVLGLSPRLYAAAAALRDLRAVARGVPPREAPPAGVPYNHGSPHVQRFTRRGLVQTLAHGGFFLDEWVNGAFAGAAVTDFLLRGARVREANADVARYLPHWAVATWYFAASRRESPPVGQPRRP